MFYFDTKQSDILRGSSHVCCCLLKNKNRYPYNLRHDSHFSRPLVKTVFHETESISYLGPVKRDILPVTYKVIPSLEAFKNGIKKWKPENCPCRFCKISVSRVGFI